MRIVCSAPVEEDMNVEIVGGGMCEVTFFENGTAVNRVDSNGSEKTEYVYDVYALHVAYYPMISTDIANNKEAWLRKAKEADERRTPVDEYQLRADVDYLEIVSAAMNPYAASTMSLDEPQSDPDVLEKARRYYPARWDIDRLRYMVLLQKLTASDFQTVTGEVYTA